MGRLTDIQNSISLLNRMQETLQFDRKFTKFEAVAEFFSKDSMIWFMRVKPQGE